MKNIFMFDYKKKQNQQIHIYAHQKLIMISGSNYLLWLSPGKRSQIFFLNKIIDKLLPFWISDHVYGLPVMFI